MPRKKESLKSNGCETMDIAAWEIHRNGYLGLKWISPNIDHNLANATKWILKWLSKPCNVNDMVKLLSVIVGTNSKRYF